MTNAVVTDVESKQKPHRDVSASTQSIQHRMNLMYQQLRDTNTEFPYTSQAHFSEAVMSADNIDSELAYWQSVIARR